MSIARRKKRAAQAHFSVLAENLGEFYDFLKKIPQPSDEEVREKFKYYNHCWKQYCVKKQLRQSAYDMFTIEVARLWEHKKEKSPDKNMN